MNVATWNMQGASHSTEDKWNKGVLPLLNAPLGWRPDLVCLQEAGAVPQSAVLEGSSSFYGPGGVVCNVGIYAWGGTERTTHRLLYYWWDEKGNRCNLGIVTRQPLPYGSFEVGLVWGAEGAVWRPAVGLRTNEGWVFSLHAISPRGPDAPGLIQAAALYARGRPWFAGGDYNREPTTFVVAGATICPPNGPTHPATRPVSRYDYFVRSGNYPKPKPGTVVALPWSDHLPVAFEF